MKTLLTSLQDLFGVRCRVTCAVLTALVAAVTAQNPVASLPDNYTREFENDYVRVTRVLYPPHAKLAGHAHTSLASAYVYLNDSGPVTFRHIGAEYGAVTRQPTIARAFRLYRGLEEVHEVENLSDRPSEFLRVEFKTDPVDPPTLRGKFFSEPTSVPVVDKVQFENAQVRITRLRWRKHHDVVFGAAAHPSVFISLADGEMGKTRWSDKDQPAPHTSMPPQGEAIRIEFKTAPMRETRDSRRRSIQRVAQVAAGFGTRSLHRADPAP